jgi:hypothetical protein
MERQSQQLGLPARRLTRDAVWVRQKGSFVTQFGQLKTLANRKDLARAWEIRLLRSGGCETAHRPLGYPEVPADGSQR